MVVSRCTRPSRTTSRGLPCLTRSPSRPWLQVQRRVPAVRFAAWRPTLAAARTRSACRPATIASSARRTSRRSCPRPLESDDRLAAFFFPSVGIGARERQRAVSRLLTPFLIARGRSHSDGQRFRRRRSQRCNPRASSMSAAGKSPAAIASVSRLWSLATKWDSATENTSTASANAFPSPR